MMGKIIHTDDLPEKLSDWERDQVYNGMDVCMTHEILSAIEPQLDNVTRNTYEFSKALQGPALEMRLRGVRVNRARVAEVLDEYYNQMEILETNLERLVREGLGIYEFNWRSPKDLQLVFYDALGIPPYKKQGRVTVDRNALEKMEEYYIARPILSHLLVLREIGKKIQVLKTEIDPDGRIRTSYNIAGTDTGRWSSSFSEFGTGTNLQNIEEALRQVFIADEGYKLAYTDGAQGESRCVGAIEWNLFEDGRYLDACESGDLHTTVAKLCWPELAWPGTPAGDRELAELPYYRHYDRRFMCKKIGHGTNYNGKPATLATQARVPIGVVGEFQPKYFTAFPAHQRWHDWVDRELRERGYLTTLTSRRRWFFGRRDDPKTLRAAIAYDPQGSLADILNTGLLQVWRQRRVQVLMQIHDAILFQFPEDQEDEVLPMVLKDLRHRIILNHDRPFEIPYDCATGWNWGKQSKENPNGLAKWRPGVKRRREAEAGILDRPVRSIHGGFRKSRAVS
jgi:DNA polymerase I